MASFLGKLMGRKKGSTPSSSPAGGRSSLGGGGGGDGSHLGYGGEDSDGTPGGGGGRLSQGGGGLYSADDPSLEIDPNYPGVSESELYPEAEREHLTREERVEAAVKSVPDAFFEPEMDEIGDILANLPAGGDAPGAGGGLGGSVAERFGERWLAREVERMETQLDAVTSKLSQRVVGSYSAFVDGMSQVQELESDLQVSTLLVKRSRSSVREAEAGLLRNSLGVMAAHRKATILRNLVDTLNGISALLQEEQSFYRMLDEGEFPAAIETLKRCKKDLARFEGYPCLAGTRVQLNDGYALLEAKMEDVMLQVCHMFTAGTFDRVIAAYYTLGKTFSVSEKLPRFFMQAVKTTMHEIVFSYVMKSTGGVDDPGKLKAGKFSQLCTKLSGQHLIPCLRHAFEIVCDILANHRALSARLAQLAEAASEAAERKCLAQIAADVDRARRPIWDKVQRRVLRILRAVDIASFKQPRFLAVLGLVSPFAEIGEDFCGGRATLLRDEMDAKARAHVRHFHRDTLEVVRMMLESEMWHPFPLAKDFAFADIKEIRAAREAVAAAAEAEAAAAGSAGASKGTSAGTGTSTGSNGNGKDGKSSSAAAVETESRPVSADGPLSRYADGVYNPFRDALADEGNVPQSPSAANDSRSRNPFAERMMADGSNNNGDDDEDDVPDELKADFIDEDAGHHQGGKSKPGAQSGKTSGAVTPAAPTVSGAGIIVTSTSLHIARLVGKYLSLSHSLGTSAGAVFDHLREVLELYLFSVYSLFRRLPASGGTAPESMGIEAAQEGKSGGGIGGGGGDGGGSSRRSNASTNVQGFDHRVRRLLARVGHAVRDSEHLRGHLHWAHGSAADDDHDNGNNDGDAAGNGNGPSQGGGGSGGGGGDTSDGSDFSIPELLSFRGNVDLDDSRTLFGLAQRTIGLESLRCLGMLLAEVRPHMEKGMEVWEKEALAHFFRDTVDVIPDLCKAVYAHIAPSFVNLDAIPPMIEKAKSWDRKVVGTEPNAYVESILDAYRVLSAHLDQHDAGTLPTEARHLIWHAAILVAVRVIVEGFSRVKKCTTEGRASMALDVKVFQKALESLSGVHPIPGLPVVTGYIQAFYISAPEDFCDWVRAHCGDYTRRQLTALAQVGVGQGLKKKQRAELIQQIEEIDRVAKQSVKI